MYEDLGEKYVEVKEEREEWINILIELERKIVATTNRLEIVELKHMREEARKNYVELGGEYE